MQQVIYVDILVFLNTVVTFILLLTVRRFTGAPTSTGRLVLASFVGGIFSLVLLAPEMGLPAQIAVKTAVCVSITLLAFRICGVRLFLRTLALFLGVSFFYAGVIWGLTRLSDSAFLTYSNGYGYVDVSFTTLIVLSVLLYLVIVGLQKTVFRPKGDPTIFHLVLYFGDRVFEGNALWDSGNDVKDVYEGGDVVVLDRPSARLLTGIEISEDVGEMVSRGLRVRLLPVRSVNGEKLLPAFTADRAVVHNEVRSREVLRPCVAVSREALGGADYQALIGRRFFEGRGD